MNQYDQKLQVMLDDFESKYALPNNLDAQQEEQAQNATKQIIQRVKDLYGSDIQASSKVTPNGATISIGNYCIYSAYDFSCFLEEVSGYNSAANILDDLLMSFSPHTCPIIKRLADEGWELVVDSYLPSLNQRALVDTTINKKDMPKALLRAISTSYVIKAFIEDCLDIDADSDKLAMKLTITNLVLHTAIKRNDRHYDIYSINDIHNVVLGFAPSHDLANTSEEQIIQKYKELGVDYLPSID